MQLLPPELLSHIFSFISVETKGRCAQVCHTWNELITNTDSLWYDEKLDDTPAELRIKQHLNAVHKRNFLLQLRFRIFTICSVVIVLFLYLVGYWMTDYSQLICKSVFQRIFYSSVETLYGRLWKLESLSSNGPWLVDGYVDVSTVCVPVTTMKGGICSQIPATYERIRLFDDDTWSEGSWHVDDCSTELCLSDAVLYSLFLNTLSWGVMCLKLCV